MQCPSCNTELPKKAKICPKCGTAVGKPKGNIKLMAIIGLMKISKNAFPYRLTKKSNLM